MAGRRLGRGPGFLSALTGRAQSSRAASARRQLSHPLLLWCWGALAVAAVAVQITGTGIDLFVLVVVLTIVIALERTIGDWAADLVGPGLVSVALAAVVGAIIRTLFAKNDRVERFYAAAERAGYRTYFGGSATSPDARPADPDALPAPEGPANADSATRALAGALRPVAEPRRRSGLSGDALVTGGQLRLLTRTPRVTPVVHIQAPRMSVVGRSVTIRAYVTGQGEPLGGSAVVFDVRGLPSESALTNETGLASADIVLRRARTYEIQARVTASEHYTESSAGALLHVVPGTYCCLASPIPAVSPPREKNVRTMVEA